MRRSEREKLERLEAELEEVRQELKEVRSQIAELRASGEAEAAPKKAPKKKAGA